jgi:hypothetical protein
MKPELKASGANLLTLSYDEVLSIFTFNFNLRRYKVGAGELVEAAINTKDSSKVGRCNLRVSKPVLKAPMVSALEISAVLVQLVSRSEHSFGMLRSANSLEQSDDWILPTI